jgi:uncharacterized RDD family membrane protein YckC
MVSRATSVQYGGFVSRLLAFIMDLIIIAIISFLGTTVIGIIAEFFDLSFLWRTFGGASQLSVTPLQAVVALTAGLFSALFGFIYFLFFWVLVGFTPGKGFLGLRIVRCDGERLGLGRAIVRLVGYWVSFIFLGLGFIWILFDRRRQGWHDKLAGTCVVYFD